jgi:hypothetical protein
MHLGITYAAGTGGVFEELRKDVNRLLAVLTPVVMKVDKVTTVTKTMLVEKENGRF